MVKKLSLAFYFCFLLGWAEPIKALKTKLTTVDLIKNHNYPAQTHYITTEDGYILQVHRIPHGIKSKTVHRKGSIFLMHGFISSSADWVDMGPNRSLGYILADLGYDVWLGNARGNSYSRNHTTLDPDTSAKFWDFSWHEIGYYDLPAMIDYMLKETGDKNFYYIGHSQGTTALFVLLTIKIKYNDQIKLASLMGAVAIMRNTLKLLKIASLGVDLFNGLFNLLGIYEIPLAIIDFIRNFGMQNCDKPIYAPICTTFFNIIGSGEDTPQIDLPNTPILFTNYPSSSSMKQIYHYMQVINSGRFRRYDYGRRKNLDLYGSETPPDYNLSLVTAPVAIYSGLNDGLADYQDADVVAKKIPNLVENYHIPYKLFNHLDHMFAKDVVELSYRKVLSVLEKF